MNEIDYYTDWNKSELIKEVKKLNQKETIWSSLG